jgi:hypothetical protein
MEEHARACHIRLAQVRVPSKDMAPASFWMWRHQDLRPRTPNHRFLEDLWIDSLSATQIDNPNDDDENDRHNNGETGHKSVPIHKIAAAIVLMYFETCLANLA